MNMLIQHFEVSGEFAIFRDPTVTSSPTTYIAPPKSSIIGLLGCLIGIDNRGDIQDYANEYCRFLAATKVGIKLLMEPQKTTINVNYVKTKKDKNTSKKPMKIELLVDPKYLIYFSTEDEYAKLLDEALSERKFVYTPYLGHAYCLARINNYGKAEGKEADNKKEFETSGTFVKMGNEAIGMEAIRPGENAHVIIERKFYHYWKDEKLELKVLKHYHPVRGKILVEDNSRDDRGWNLWKMAKIAEIEDRNETVFLY